MVQNVRRVFDEKPEYLKSSFLEHIRSGLPHTCSFITHEKPPKDGIEVLLQDFVIPRHVLTREGLAPCPICSPIKAKYVKGHLLWSSESKALYAVGHCCGHGFFTEGSLTKALTRNTNAERRRRAEEFIEANWRVPSELVAYWAKLKQSARDLDKVLKAIRVGLRVGVCRDIHRTMRDGGYLKVQQQIGDAEAETPEGLRTVERAFGSAPVQGASILRGGSRGPISVESNLSNLTAALSHIDWKTEDDAILWICEQVDTDLFRLRDFIEEAIEGIEQVKTDIVALHLFLDADNLRLINSWCYETHGGKGSVSLQNEGGHITIQRGGRRHRSFWLPTSLLNVPGGEPTLFKPTSIDPD
ncbi:hypothetical protein QO004_004106 [Rhizobium mesoamericanum]|uniref:hypothetical protein n=1 Tax=Rhizobium mesoamericanum TaxID=1079800 RepID=UPI0027809F70|nr:hypothetical protein [Rhizobium mesoamericanum]MDQ0562301.1 hypothetical protein [Rhizobium mesoamericanum]